ncbi:hypothetical protein F511_08622 [Dorcoceras hygrometricum]|uniref:Pollen Ole e 1 allergen and extensin family protein n=1 Tax=Dorcoceras hygrometricum TaxID=472368 RepID=A0A2Z7CIF0_9LAMI|nr:hypothetical protein F511_08622 [Dorcoceras hygrometricum]
MSLFWTAILLFLTYGNLSEAKDVKKLPSLAAVYGTAYCDTCFRHRFPQIRHFISGASVAVECKDTSSSKISFRQEVKTNENGEFKVHLPPYISKHVRKIKGCSVNLVSSNHPYCAVAATASHKFRSGKQGRNIFSEGFLTLRPMKEPQMCDERPGVKDFKDQKAEKSSISNPNDPAFLPPIQDPTPSEQPTIGIYLPPLPLLPRLPPLPLLPRLPPLPGIPYLPPKNEAAVKSSQVVDNKGK